MRVADIIQCIQKIESYTRGYTFDDFRRDNKTIDSVLRNLEIIGEAARHIPPEIKTQYRDLPWAEMLAMRNIVIHEYHGVDHKIIWQTVREDLPPLVHRLEQMLEKE